MTPNIKIFKVPDSTFFLIIPNNLSPNSFNKALIEYKNKFEENCEVRIIWDKIGCELEIKKKLQEIICKNSKNKFEILDYKTNFFRFDRNNLTELLKQKPELNWQKYQTEFSYEEISKEDFSKKEVFKNFMLNSFGVNFIKENNKMICQTNSKKQKKIQGNFEIIWQNPSLKMILVSKKKIQGNFNQIDAQEFVGCYCLTSVYQDLQLYSVAGISNLKMCSEKKLPILMSSLVNIFAKDTTYQKCKKLTLSNSKSKVAKIYENLGASPNPERAGFVVQNLSYH